MTLRALWPVTQQFQNKNGSNLVSGKVYIYYQGRTALATTYHDEEGTVVNSNPVLLDNNGRATVFANTIYSYTIVVCDYYGKELFSQDITLHDAISTAKDVIIMGSDGSVKVDTTTLPNGVQYDLSVYTDIIATKKSVDDVKIDLNNLTGKVDNHTTQIEQIQQDINGIDSSLAKKKDKQNDLNFNGSATKTVKKITQNANGELNVEFEDINFLGYNISSSDNSINVSSTGRDVDLTLPSDVVRDSAYTHIDAATTNPLMDGTAAVGMSTKYAREDHVHPSDTSREDIANKTTVILGTSDNKYPTDKAVAEFVNSSIATNTANYISNNGEPFTSVEQLEAYSGPVTNNDYAFVTGTDPEGNTYYDRYKATVKGSSVTWSLEYRLNNSSFTAAQWSAINSGITSALVAKIHTHSNKAVLDGITSSDVANWNNKMNNQTVGSVSEPVYLENGIAKIATNVATTGNLEAKLNVDGSNATTEGVTNMMKKVASGSAGLTDDSYYFGDSNSDHTQIVRRPILNLWDYFAPKVDRKVDRKIVDKLGSVGSADKPIYLENGVPKVCTDGIPYSEVSYGGSVGYGVFVGGAHNLANRSRCYCTFFISVASYPDNIAHTYIGTFTFRGGVLNKELKCLTGTPVYPLRIATIYNEDGKDSNGNPTYTLGLYVIPDDNTYKYSSYKITRIASSSDFIWDVKALSSATYDELNSVAKPSLRPIILTWDASGGNISKTGGTWIPTFDRATIIDCRGIVDMSIQVDLSIIGQRTYVDTITNYDITLVNSSKNDILPASMHQSGRMPRQTYSSSSTIDGTIDTSHTHRFIFPITSTSNFLAGYIPKIKLPSNYPLDDRAQVNIKALCRGIVLPYGADAPF